jgi:Fe-S-cluster-containing dehydrogenase component
MEFSRALCESAGLDAERVVRTDAPRRKREKTRVPLNAPGSRREMFRAIAAGWKATATTDSTPDAGTEKIPAPAERFRDIVQRHPENPKRSHLLEVLRALPGIEVKSKTVPAARTPLAQLEITSQCVGCNVCETLCPVGALQHRTENGIYTLDFGPALCTGCRVCEAACYYKAVHIGEIVDLSVLFERPTITLIRAAQRTCKACRAPILDSSSELCPLCVESEKRRQAIARRFLFPGDHRDSA